MVSEVTIVRAHDRGVPLSIKMFFSGNRTQKSFGCSDTKEAAQDWASPKAMWDIQEALLNYADVYAQLWPSDDTPRIISRVLVHYKYGANHKASDSEKVKMVMEFCDSVMRENASRAVVKDPPLSARDVKERWADMVERYAHLSSNTSTGPSNANSNNHGPTGGAKKAGAGKQTKVIFPLHITSIIHSVTLFQRRILDTKWLT
jgi:hypothetical protein